MRAIRVEIIYFRIIQLCQVFSRINYCMEAGIFLSMGLLNDMYFNFSFRIGTITHIEHNLFFYSINNSVKIDG